MGNDFILGSDEKDKSPLSLISIQNYMHNKVMAFFLCLGELQSYQNKAIKMAIRETYK